jgi:hypothetical protein
MDANIKTPQDALEWLDRSIREEAELDGEMSNAHAIQLGFIQNMLEKFPCRNCDVAQDWLRDLYVNFKPPASVKREMPPEWVDAVMAFCRWLVAPATEKEGGAK